MRTFKQLVEALNEVQGVPFVEVAYAHGIQWFEEPARNKGLAGKIVEAALGLQPNPRSEADLTYLGLEVKTVPISDGLRPLENTKITMLNFQDVVDQPWESSTVYHKLRSIIFVPVVKYDLARPDRWFIRSPFVWMPSLEAERMLLQDYAAVRALLAAGKPDEVSSARPPKGQGTWLMANTGGADSRDTTKYTVEGREFVVKRRAWFLRKDFVEMVLRENMTYRPQVDAENGDANRHETLQQNLTGAD